MPGPRDDYLLGFPSKKKKKKTASVCQAETGGVCVCVQPFV